MLVLQAGKHSLTLLLPCSHPGKADFEAMAAKPKEYGCCGRRPLCLGSVCANEALATSSLLLEKPLMMGGLLAFIGGMLVKELLAMIGLLVVVSGTFFEEALAGRCLVAGTFFHPQGVPGMLPEHVLFLCVPLTCKKRWPPHC